jgi:UDP-glucose 6-dehydrogenase
LAESLKARVVGAGYVVLVTGACLYHLGYRAACVDKGKARLRRLREGRMPFYEPSRFARVCEKSDKTLSWFSRTREHIGEVS